MPKRQASLNSIVFFVRFWAGNYVFKCLNSVSNC